MGKWPVRKPDFSFASQSRFPAMGCPCCRGQVRRANRRMVRILHLPAGWPCSPTWQGLSICCGTACMCPAVPIPASGSAQGTRTLLLCRCRGNACPASWRRCRWCSFRQTGQAPKLPYRSMPASCARAATAAFAWDVCRRLFPSGLWRANATRPSFACRR